jgi:hypothetical protein
VAEKLIFDEKTVAKPQQSRSGRPIRAKSRQQGLRAVNPIQEFSQQ